MIKVINYVKFFFEETKEIHFETNDVVLIACLVYQFLYVEHFKTYLSINEILQINNGEIGLIGPGNGCLTWFLERTIGNIEMIHSHSINYYMMRLVDFTINMDWEEDIHMF